VGHIFFEMGGADASGSVQQLQQLLHGKLDDSYSYRVDVELLLFAIVHDWWQSYILGFQLTAAIRQGNHFVGLARCIHCHSHAEERQLAFHGTNDIGDAGACNLKVLSCWTEEEKPMPFFA
jgi:hypothetical protein